MGLCVCVLWDYTGVVVVFSLHYFLLPSAVAPTHPWAGADSPLLGLFTAGLGLNAPPPHQVTHKGYFALLLLLNIILKIIFIHIESI